MLILGSSLIVIKTLLGKGIKLMYTIRQKWLYSYLNDAPSLDWIQILLTLHWICKKFQQLNFLDHTVCYSCLAEVQSMTNIRVPLKWVGVNLIITQSEFQAYTGPLFIVGH